MNFERLMELYQTVTAHIDDAELQHTTEVGGG